MLSSFPSVVHSYCWNTVLPGLMDQLLWYGERGPVVEALCMALYCAIWGPVFQNCIMWGDQLLWHYYGNQGHYMRDQLIWFINELMFMTLWEGTVIVTLCNGNISVALWEDQLHWHYVRGPVAATFSEKTSCYNIIWVDRLIYHSLKGPFTLAFSNGI